MVKVQLEFTSFIRKETMRRSRTTQHGIEDETIKSSCYPGVPDEFTTWCPLCTAHGK